MGKRGILRLGLVIVFVVLVLAIIVSFITPNKDSKIETTSQNLDVAESPSLCARGSTTCGPLYISYLGDENNLPLLKLFVCDFYDCRTGNTQVLNNEGYFQHYSDIVVGLDNLPFIVYSEKIVLSGNNISSEINNTVSKIIIAHCGDKLCTPSLITENEILIQTNIEIGSLSVDINKFSGIPLLSYYDKTNGDLKVINCISLDCSTFDPPVIADSQGDVGDANTLSMQTRDNNPLIAYHDKTNGYLKVMHCTSLDCSTFDVQRTLDYIDSGSTSISMSISQITFEPIITYYDTLNQVLKTVHCTNFECSSNEAPITLDSQGNVGRFNSITFGEDENPTISYYTDEYPLELRIVHCTLSDCSTFDPPITLDSQGTGLYNSIAIAKDNMPVISYSDFTNHDLKFIHCTSIDCSTFDPPITLDSQGIVGSFSSIDSV